tara:strand:- start:18157 stop:18639 length:483 start_codon:yes stop_codon:yes gene_type:complete
MAWWDRRDRDLTQAAAEARARRQREVAQEQRDVQEGQQIGSAVGGLAGMALGLIPPLAPAAPVLGAAGSAVGGQIGRAASGGSLGYDTPGAAVQDVSSISTAAMGAADENDYLDLMDDIVSDPDKWKAYSDMPDALQAALRTSRGRDSWDRWYGRYTGGQ